MRKLISLILSIVLLLVVAVPPVSADTRCGGNAGVQVWQDSSKGGPSAVLCWPLYGPWFNYQNLSDVTTNLGFGANWNDRISSYSTFNLTGHSLTFYSDTKWSAASTGGRVVVTSGNAYVANLKDLWGQQLPNGYNDRISSIKFLP